MVDLDPETLRRLDNGAAELLTDGVVVGHLTTVLERGWGTARPFGTQTFVWLLATKQDGTREIIEDYPPYITVPEVRAGHLDLHGDGVELFEVRWLEGDRRQEVWDRFGIHESPGFYLAENATPVRWPWAGLIARLRRGRH